MMPVLQERGDIALTLGDVALHLRPTFAALCSMEEQTGQGLIALARRFADGAFTLNDCRVVIEAGLMGAGQVVPSHIGELILKAGLLTLATPLTRFLEAALLGDSTARD